MNMEEEINETLLQLEKEYRPTKKFQNVIKPLVDKVYDHSLSREEVDRTLKKIEDTYKKYQKEEQNNRFWS